MLAEKYEMNNRNFKITFAYFLCFYQQNLEKMVCFQNIFKAPIFRFNLINRTICAFLIDSNRFS